MSVSTSLRSRVEFETRSLGLAVGDVVAIGMFVVAGTIQHGEDPVANPLLVPEVVAPFLVGWTVAAVAASLYTGRAISSVRECLRLTVPAWLLAVVIGQGLRALPFTRGNAAPAFVMVTLVVGGALVVGWRTIATVLVGRE